MIAQNTRLGILMMLSATLVFAAQDAISRYMAEQYPVLMVVMIRYWAFAAFVVVIAVRSAGGLRHAVATRQPGVQILRGLLLAGQICLMVLSFVTLGLAAAHAVFTAYPLIVAALSGPLLGEKVGWRRWTAILVGFAGILVILQPGGGVWQPAALIPLAAATGFALYSLLTRYVARDDSAAVSFFWTGVTGAVVMTGAGIWVWVPMAPPDMGWMAVLCCTGILGHWLVIRCYEVAEASAVQPFAYVQLVWATTLGVLLFDETLYANTVVGAVLVVAAGLFTLWRQRQLGTGG